MATRFTSGGGTTGGVRDLHAIGCGCGRGGVGVGVGAHSVSADLEGLQVYSEEVRLEPLLGYTYLGEVLLRMVLWWGTFRNAHGT